MLKLDLITFICCSLFFYIINAGSDCCLSCPSLCVAPGSHNKLSVHNTAVTFWQNMRMWDIYNIYTHTIYTESTISTQCLHYLAVLIDTPYLHFPPRAEWEHICEQFNDSMGSCRHADIVRPKLKVCCISIVINWAKLTRWDCGRVHSLVSLKPEKLHHCTVKLRTGAALRTGYCEYQRYGPQFWLLHISLVLSVVYNAFFQK